jgi:hypothetical protein
MNEIPRHGKLTSPRSTYQDCLARTLHAIGLNGVQGAGKTVLVSRSRAGQFPMPRDLVHFLGHEKRRGIWVAAVSLGMNAQAIE